MDTTNIEQLNKIMDRYNEAHEILWEQILNNQVDKHTVQHIKSQLKRALEMIPTEKYETIRKELYSCLQVINM